MVNCSGLNSSSCLLLICWIETWHIQYSKIIMNREQTKFYFYPFTIALPWSNPDWFHNEGRTWRSRWLIHKLLPFNTTTSWLNVRAEEQVSLIGSLRALWPNRDCFSPNAQLAYFVDLPKRNYKPQHLVILDEEFFIIHSLLYCCVFHCFTAALESMPPHLT